MPRPPKQTKAETLQKLKQVFRDHGYEGASMQALSEATGLSKASLYHHFPDGKQEMASQVLLEEGRKLQSLVLAPLSEKRNSEALIDSLSATAEFYDSDVPQCLMNSLTLGEGGRLFGDTVKETVAAWRTVLAANYQALGASSEEADAWSAYALERIQGALVMSRVEASRAPLEQCLSELEGDVRYYLDA